MELHLRGEFAPESLERFVRARAARLQLTLRIEQLDADVARLRVGGQRDLVDAFVMACSLGPSDCLVESAVTR